MQIQQNHCVSINNTAENRANSAAGFISVSVGNQLSLFETKADPWTPLPLVNVGNYDVHNATANVIVASRI